MWFYYELAGHKWDFILQMNLQQELSIKLQLDFQEKLGPNRVYNQIKATRIKKKKTLLVLKYWGASAHVRITNKI